MVVVIVVVVVVVIIITITIMMIIVTPIIRYQTGIQFGIQYYILCRQQIENIKWAHATLWCVVLVCGLVRCTEVSDRESRRNPISPLAILVCWTGLKPVLLLFFLINSSKQKKKKNPNTKCTTIIINELFSIWKNLFSLMPQKADRNIYCEAIVCYLSWGFSHSKFALLSEKWSFIQVTGK